MIEKVISGGQIGADLAGLRAAASLQIPTGGHAPKGYRTLEGNKPTLGGVYGLEEHESWQYPPRTRANVRNSDGTIRFAVDFTTAGERCTLREVQAAGKPVFDVTLKRNATGGLHLDPPLTAAINWMWENGITVLNVAGNGRVNIEEAVEHYLRLAIRAANTMPQLFKDKDQQIELLSVDVEEDSEGITVRSMWIE